MLNCCYFDLGNVFVSRLGSFRLFFFNPLRALWEQQLKGKEILRLETGVEIARLKILSCFSESRKIIVFLWWWLSSKAMLFNVCFCLENFGRRNLLLYLYFETIRDEIESRSEIQSFERSSLLFISLKKENCTGFELINFFQNSIFPLKKENWQFEQDSRTILVT